MNTIPFGMPEEMCLSALCDAGETMRHTPSGRDLSRRRQNICVTYLPGVHRVYVGRERPKSRQNGEPGSRRKTGFSGMPYFEAGRREI